MVVETKRDVGSSSGEFEFSFVYLVIGLIILGLAWIQSVDVALNVGHFSRIFFLPDFGFNLGYVYDFLRYTLLFGVLPITAFLVFYIILFIKRKTVALELILGGLCVVWGFLLCLDAHSAYHVSILMAYNIDHSLLATYYAAYGLVGVLWVLTGIFLIATFLKVIRKSRSKALQKLNISAKEA